tara:strand:+ start:304 stop:1224 length:921 start_codon:yes stop_codon:yes gene_type:complete
MNILFAGTPNSSANILQSLINDNGFNIVGVLTQPDKKGKRGNQLLESEVSVLAKQHDIPLYKPIDLKKDSILNKIKLIKADYLIVIAYGKILPDWLIDMPKICSINIHFSLLPEYRGASPIQSALLNGDKKTGITYMKISSELDAGDILSSYEIDIKDSDNKLILEENLTSLCMDNISEVLNNISNNKISFKAQNNAKATYCKKITKQDSLINFDDESKNIINKFRAYFVWPGVNFIFKGVSIKIHGIDVTNINSAGNPGDLLKIDKSGIHFNTRDMVVVITHLQFPNKNPISSLDAYNSHQDFFK